MQPTLDIPHLNTPLKRAKKAIPKLCRLVDQLRAHRGNFFPDWPDWCFLPWVAGIYLVGKSSYGTYTGELGMMATWRLTQGVYRFDPDIYAEVVSTPVHRVPCEALYFIPEWSVFIPTPDLEDSPGFWARLEWGHTTFPDFLELVLLRPDGSTSFARLFLFPGATLDEAVDRTWNLEFDACVQTVTSHPDAPQFAHAANFVAGWSDAEYRRQEHDRLRSWVEPRLALLLYLCSRNKDISHPDNRLPANPAPRKTKKGMRHFPAQAVRQWDIGVRVGAALRRAREAADSSGGTAGTGQRKRPHIRRAHWHSYWTGSWNGDRKLVLKWVQSTSVNVENPEHLPTTIRPVPADEAA